MTSGQYSYLLLRRLQIYVSCKDICRRTYLYNFFGGIFNDPSVVVTESSYNQFVELMDYEMDYAAKKNLYTPEDVYGDENFNTSYNLLQNSFAAIGVTLEMTKDGDGYPSALVFTLPSGEQKVLDGLNSWDTEKGWGYILEFRHQLRVTDEYLELMYPYYRLQHETVYDLAEIGSNSAGYGSRWTYNADTQTLDISGNGSLVSADFWAELDIDKTTITSVILGAGINRLYKGALGFSSGTTFVFFHGRDKDITLDSGWIPTNRTSTDTKGNVTEAHSYVIYTDNLKIRNYDYGGTTIEFRSLSDWEG